MKLVRTGSARILDFDIECRPLAWYGGDFVTKQPTAIAWKFIGERGKVEVAVIGESDRNSRVLAEERAMVEEFRAAYNEADIVTGHYIRGFDLTLLVSSCERLNLPVFGDILVQDTKNDYVRAHGISKSMENLGAMYELRHPKVPMNTGLWGQANMLLPEGIALTKKRVLGDVREHTELRAEMLRRGVLGRARVWTAGAMVESKYQP